MANDLDEPLMSANQAYVSMLRYRGVSSYNVCTACRGYGVQHYSSTATWRGGMGGQAFTYDVCDECWGSGRSDKKWLNLRTLEDDVSERVKRQALGHIAYQCGAQYGMMKNARHELKMELEKFARGRKKRPEWFTELCQALVKVLSD